MPPRRGSTNWRKRFDPIPLPELEALCGRPGCGHQYAVHIGGAETWGWPIFVEEWMNALGSCSAKGCACTKRIRGERPPPRVKIDLDLMCALRDGALTTASPQARRVLNLGVARVDPDRHDLLDDQPGRLLLTPKGERILKGLMNA